MTTIQFIALVAILVVIIIPFAVGVFKIQTRKNELEIELDENIKELEKYNGQLPLGTVIRLPEDYRVFDLDNPRKVGQSWPIISQYFKLNSDGQYEFKVTEIVGDEGDIYYRLPISGKRLYVQAP